MDATKYFKEISDKYSATHTSQFSENEKAKIIEAIRYAHEVHNNQIRNSGETYFQHVYNTAKYCAEFGMDAESIVSALLHESHEIGGIEYDEIEKRFGKSISFIIKKIDEIGRIKYFLSTKNIESLRKFIVFMAEDLRIIMIKFADRMDNLRTLNHVKSPQKRIRIARESIEIYSQLASRLGMGKMADKMRNMAFEYAYPKEYKLVKKLLRQKTKSMHKSMDKVFRSIKRILAENQLGHCKVQYRIKSTYSLYKKLLSKNMNIDAIHDIIALRVTTDTVEECYRILGLIHGNWKPVPGRIKDYIALPKANGYQSLHTTIFIGNGDIAEIQIRTKEMHHFAEYGAASHVGYKNKSQKIFDWISQIREISKDNTNIKPGEYLKILRNDFLNDRIFVITPKGDIIDLPKGSSVLDFAYSIHTEIGNHAEGAYINGKYSSIRTKLKNMDVVEVKTNNRVHPSIKWIEVCKTSNAKKQIQSYLRKTKKEAEL